MKSIAIAVSAAVLSTQALAQTITQERHNADVGRLEAEIEQLDQELRDRASVIEADAWARVMAEDTARKKRETKEIIRQMDESRARREAEQKEKRLKRWQANPYRYEVRFECPPEPKSIFAAMSAAWKPRKPCTYYFVRILINLEGKDVGTPPERIAGYPPTSDQLQLQ